MSGSTLRNEKLPTKVNIVKDTNIETVEIKVYLSSTVNCKRSNVFFYKRANVDCHSMARAAMAAGSQLDGNMCRYELRCNQGDVICVVEIHIINNNDINWSICEIEF